MIVIKTYSTADQCRMALNFYETVGHQAPPNVKRRSHVSLQYDFVIGSYPHDRLDEVLGALDVMHMSGDIMLALELDVYIDHLYKVNDDAGYYLSGVIKCLERYAKNANQITTCHGDCTLGNILRTVEDDYIFLDPAYARGFPCKELDEAKLLQSLDGWEHVKYGFPLPVIPTGNTRIEVGPLHFALLGTHYWRMLPYQSDHEDATRFAWARIRELNKLCKHFV